MYELIVRGGEVVDGTGARRFRADVAVENGRIAAVGDLKASQAGKTIDAVGKVVTPGFVDMHSHADLTLPVCSTADNLVMQGITTVVAGQCGMGVAPLLPETRKLLIAVMSSVSESLSWEWDSFGSYLGYLRGIGISVNLVPLVMHGVIRGGVMGFSPDPASPELMARMHAELSRAMDEGAVGTATGLIYPPGIYTQTQELIDFTRPVGMRGGHYFTHIRDEGDGLFDALDEAIMIGRDTGASVQISHFKAAGADNYWKTEPALKIIDRARLDGLDIAADMYPYTFGNTVLFALLPAWATAGGKDLILRRLQDPLQRDKMAGDMKTKGFFRILDWERVMINKAPRRPEYVGRWVEDLAEGAHQSPYDWIFDSLLETELDIEMLIDIVSEENLPEQMHHPAMMIGTDSVAYSPGGLSAPGLPHPRGFGAFPRVLRRYVREQHVLKLEEAIWKMSGQPAQLFGWTDRGRVADGYAADLVVFDPLSVADCATYEDPCQYPTGIEAVLVNGSVVVERGVHTGAKTGHILSRR